MKDASLIRIPYFVQIADDTLMWLFGYEKAKEYNILGQVESEYQHGFIDQKCVLPGGF